MHLDSAGSCVYPKLAIEKFHERLTSQLYGNPHSLTSIASQTSIQLIDRVRSRVLRLFNVSSSEYTLVFTSGATAALKLLYDHLEVNGDFYYHQLSHTSVVGLRSRFNSHCFKHPLAFKPGSLVAFPAQCNFSGSLLPLNWIHLIESSECYSLLDASSYLGSHFLNLKQYSADFVVCSFYKIFGFPTGLGCLLVRNKSSHLLSRPSYFGGGTIDALSIEPSGYYRLKSSLSERLEHGTLPFLEIVGLECAMDAFDELYGVGWNFEYLKHLYDYCKDKLLNLLHSNGQELVEIYGFTQENGPIIAFNLFNDQGDYIGYSVVEKLAFVNNISIRTGCFCNPGACQLFLGISSDQVESQSKIHGKRCGDSIDLINGQPTGAVRISFGLNNTREEIDEFVKVLCNLISKPRLPAVLSNDAVIQEILVYPIKSCAALRVNHWKISKYGLEYDRHWKIVDESGKSLTLGKYPQMTQIKPLDLSSKRMIVSVYNETFEISIDGVNLEFNQCITRLLGFNCKLIAAENSERVDVLGKSIEFSNESQFLLVNQSSFDQVYQLIPSDLQQLVTIYCFRPNFIIKSSQFTEDLWIGEHLSVDNINFTATEQCQRCQVVCVTESGSRTNEPLSTLAKYRKIEGKLMFGVYLSLVDGLDATISTGSVIKVV